MSKGLVTATDYDFLIQSAVRAMQHIEGITGEMDNEQRQQVANKCFNLVMETLLRHGPRGQGHQAGMNAAYKRFVDGRETVADGKVIEIPPALQDVEPLEMEGEDGKGE